MDIEQIKYFLVLSQTLNFTKTADMLYVSQPTISRQIKLLEDELGIELFCRISKNIKLTPAGTVLYNSVSVAYDAINQGIEKASKISNNKQGTIKIGCALSLAIDSFLSDCYRIFSKRYPDIHFIYEKNNFLTLKNKLKENELDLIFGLYSAPHIITDVEMLPLFDATCVLVFRKEDMLSLQRPPIIEDFNDKTLICLSEEYNHRGLKGIQKICESNNLKFKNVIRVPNLESVFFYLYAGIGFALMDKSVKDIYSEELSYIEIMDDVAKLTAVALYNESNDNPTIPHFVDILMKESKKLKEKYL